MAGIYLHIPFCRQACTYCNFHFSTLLKTKHEVLNAMLEEIAMQRHFLGDKTVIETIYFGGGTPSLLSTREVNAFLQAIQKNFTVSEHPEITLEANPDDLSKAYLTSLKQETAINRFSIGIQSFFDADLQYMHRAHNAAEAIHSVKNAQDIGFENLSVDLIYGTPTMSDECWEKNLQTVFDLHIPHVSCYALTVEDKTVLSSQINRNKTEAPSDERMVQQFSILQREMKMHAYTHYEISNFCREPQFARHNSNYWKGVPYLGIGPSAHSYDGESRFWNISNNAIYAKKILQRETANEREILSKTDRYNEYVMTNIRTISGVDAQHIATVFGDAFLQHFLFEIAPFEDNKWVMQEGETYRLSDSGKLFCDYITENLFLTEEE